MKERILIRFIVGTIIQLILYLGVLYLLKVILDFVTEDRYIRLNLYGIQLSSIIFTIIISVQNLLTSIFNSKWFTWTAIIVVLAIYTSGWGEDFSSWPIRTLIFFIVGFSVVLLKPTIDSNLTELVKKKKTDANIGH